MMEPMPFQIEVANEIEWFGGRSLIACDMGLGKTPMSLWYWNRHIQESSPCVVVCPASVKFQWEQEAMRITGHRAAVLEGQTPSENGNVSKHPKLVVVNFDILRHWLDWLLALKPKMVIVDECHYAMSSGAKRTKALKKLCQGVPRMLALSGTPMVNRPIELWPILQMLRPDIFVSKWSFAHRFCDPRYTPWGWEFKGSSNTTELNSLLMRNVMVRRRTSDVLKELPELIREVVPVPMSDSNEYRRADYDFITWLRRQDPAAAQRAGKAETMVKMGALLRLAAKLKADAVSEWIENFLAESDEKLVVFGVHREMLKLIRDRCSCQSILIDGSVTGEHRRTAVKLFASKRYNRVLFGNLQAAGVGVDGLQVARTVLMVEFGWTPGGVRQAEKRCHRIGTQDTVFSTWLVARGTLEEKLCRVLQKKQETSDSILDGGGGEEKLNVYEQLLRELKKENKS